MLDYFGAYLDRTPMADVPECQRLSRDPRRPSGLLLPATDDDRPHVWVDPYVTRGGFRWTVFHEVGHHDLRHEGTDFVDDDRSLRPALGAPQSLPTEYRTAAYQALLPDLTDEPEGTLVPRPEETADSISRKQQEREANLYAGEMMMPSQWFAPDARDLPTSIEAVRQLRVRYNASFEATAIRYAQACPDKCAVLAAEPTNDGQGIVTGFSVLYVRRGERGFLRGLHQEARLPFSGPLATAWDTTDSVPIRGPIAPRHLGLTSGPTLAADALKLGRYGRVVALLWFESGQLPIFTEGETP